MIKNEKKVLILSVLAVVLLIIVVVGATYAYFVVQGGASANTNVNVGTNTTDNLSFSVGDAISITANQDNFAQGAGNQAGSTTASATLTANNATNTATRNYYLYLNITSNDFEYTLDENIPELILTVRAPDGTSVQNISGLKYVTVGEVSGFDITTASNVITLADNYEISATDTPTTQEWNITVTFVNLDTDQVGNAGKTFEATVIIQEEPLTSSQNLASYITETLYTADGVNGLYLHDGAGSYTNSDQEAGDNSYRFSGGDYKVTSTAVEAGLTRVYTAANTETDGVINFYCNGAKQYVAISCIATQEHYYTTAYNEETHYNTLEEALAQAVTDGYLTSDNIKNFVCFGPGASEGACSIDNLYRIIGVFDGQAKLIKYDYVDTKMLGEEGDYGATNTANFYSGMRNDHSNNYWYYWNGSSTNNWSTSELNTVNLNTNYWDYLTSEWQSKIINTTWKVGGNTAENISDVSVKTAYTNEIVSPTEVITYQDEIGLMYVSDYMYAVDPSNWTTAGNRYNSINGDNWMYMGDAEWTISRRSDIADYAFGVGYRGYVGGNGDVDVNIAVRPVFYLNSNVQIYEGHAGTQSDPYRIVLNQ